MQKLLSYVRRAVDHYHMIQDGDRIAVGVSGGKDSLALLVALAKLRAFYPARFDVTAITIEMDEMDKTGMNFSPVQALCDELQVPYIRVQTQIRQIIFDIRQEENPCALCANMRRGALHEAAVRAGCNKTALGHHFDDVVETYLLSLFYEGRIACFQPVTFLDRTGITVIRPLLYTPESYIRSFAGRCALPVVPTSCPADGNTKRQSMKDLVKTIESDMPGLRQRIFGAIQRYPLRGWSPDRTRKPKSPRPHDHV